MMDEMQDMEQRVVLLEQALGELRAQIDAGLRGMQEPRIVVDAPQARPLVLMDLDGVLADFNTAYWRALVGPGHRHLLEPAFDKWLWPAEVATHFRCAQVWGELQYDQDFWAYLPLYDWTCALRDVLEDGVIDGDWEVVFITSRPNTEAVRVGTEKWLADELCWDQDINLVVTDDKAEWATRAGAPILLAVDDKPEHLDAYHLAGIPARLWAAPWNAATLQRLEALDGPAALETTLYAELACLGACQ